MTDEFDGHGGTYLMDPITGRRTLVRRTSERASAVPEPDPLPEAAEAEPATQPEKDTP